MTLLPVIKGTLLVHDMLWQYADVQCWEIQFGACSLYISTPSCKNGSWALVTSLLGDKRLAQLVLDFSSV